MRLLIVLAWAHAVAVAVETDPAAVLLRVTIKERVRASSLPNYTCVETVNRDYYKPKAAPPEHSCSMILEQKQRPTLDSGLRFVLTDRLRLDVALTDRGEMYSWVGASKFEDSGIEQVVHMGPIGTGSFGAFLAVIFGQDPKTFHFLGNTLEAGRNLMTYLFQVEKQASRYKVRAGDGWVYTAYSGSIQIDPETLEVVRMMIQTAELPAETGSCQTTTTMDFRPTRIGDGEFLLPTLGRQRFVDLNGDEVENTTTLAACREYRGESTITFFPEPESTAANGGKNAPAPAIQLTPGQPFVFELTTPIAADTAAGGDPFAGRLATAIRDRKGKVVAPAHAPVEGRLLRVEVRRTAPLAATLVLKLRTVEIGGVPVPLTADRDWRKLLSQRKGQVEIPMSFPWERNSGVFRVQGEHAVMKAGSQSDWITEAQ